MLVHNHTAMDSDYIRPGWRLEQFHLLLCLIHVASSGVLAVLLGTSNASTWPIFETIVSREGITTTHRHPSIKAAWFLVAAGFISATHHGLVRLYKLSDRSARVLRWADYMISSAFMLIVIALLSGVGNPWLLLNTGVIQAMLMIASGVGEAIIEEQKETASRQGYVFVFLASCIHGVCCWGAVFSALYYQNVPVFVYVIVIGLFFLFMLFGVVYVYVIRYPNNINKADWFYALLSLTAKLQLQWTLYGGTATNTNQTLAVSLITGFIVVSSCTAAVFILKHVSSE